MENIKKLNTEKECQALFEERIASLGLALNFLQQVRKISVLISETVITNKD